MNLNTNPEINKLMEKLGSVDCSPKISNIYRIWSIEKEIEQLEFLIAGNSSEKIKEK